MVFWNLAKQWAMKWANTLSKVFKEGIREEVLEYRARSKERHLVRYRKEQQRLAEDEARAARRKARLESIAARRASRATQAPAPAAVAADPAGTTAS